jgi:hypothetical protein
LTSATQQFVWKDRDTAAHDLLQLAYYAPPHISRLAIQVLQAIRSPQIVPALTAIVGDTEREIWQRIYALRAITNTPGYFFIPEFEQHAQLAIQKRIIKVRGLPRKPSDNLWFGIDLLEEIDSFVSKHPQNQAWFLAALDSIEEPYVLWRFLEHILLFHQSMEYKQQLIERLFKLYDDYPDFLSISTINHLYGQSDVATTWSNTHFDLIFERCLQDSEDWAVTSLAREWNKLREALIAKVDTFKDKLSEEPPVRASKDIDTTNSLALRFLEDTYLAALDGNKTAYSHLLKATRLWKGFIPFRAIATYYVGKLQDRYDVFPTLNALMGFTDDWGDNPMSPIRFEASEALIRKPSAAVWLTLVNSFFINPRNFLVDFQLDWIAYVTDVLSGISQPYSGVHYGDVENRAWFKALTALPDDEAMKLIEAVSG